jgi:hypothetical protein
MKRIPRRFAFRVPLTVLSAACLTLLFAEPADAQLERAEPRPDVQQTRSYDGLAEGPYGSLLIRNVMLLPGHGGPGQGPMDILIRGNVIDDIRSHDPDRSVEADRVIEGGPGICGTTRSSLRGSSRCTAGAAGRTTRPSSSRTRRSHRRSRGR